MWPYYIGSKRGKLQACRIGQFCTLFPEGGVVWIPYLPSSCLTGGGGAVGGTDPGGGRGEAAAHGEGGGAQDQTTTQGGLL